MTAISCPWTMIARGGQQIDAEEVRRAVALLFDPDGTHEVRGVPSGRSRAASARQVEAVVQAVDELANGLGVYYSLNPVDPSRSGAARDRDILRRRWLLVDVDPFKADGAGDLPSTDTEKAAAMQAGSDVAEYLSDQGWPNPVVIDSGNGCHLLYRVDLPNDALAKQLVKQALRALKTRWPGVDDKVFNSSRIAKLPGTWARKSGGTTADRPARLCRLLSVPRELEVVTSDQLQALGRAVSGAEPTPEPDPVEAPAPDPWTIKITDGRLPAYLERALEGEATKVAMSVQGARNDTLNKAAFRVGQLIGLGLDESEARARLIAAATRSGLSYGEAEFTARRAMAEGQAFPRPDPTLEQPRAKAKTAAAASQGQAKPEPDNVPLTIRGSAVRPQKVRWLWAGRVPLGFVTVFAGPTGVGKSFVTHDISARITTGRDLPDDPSPAGECRPVLIVSEDPYEFVLAPRLIELGADMDLVSFMTWEAMACYSLSDTEMLERAWQEASRPALLVIDPPTNFLGSVDEHKNAEVRAALMRLVAWLADKEVACILITHVNKGGSSGGVAALNRVIGSVAWLTTSRIAHTFAQDPEDPNTCLFVPMKSNLGAKPQALSYRIQPTDSLATVEWLGTRDISADEAVNASRKNPKVLSAKESVVALFRERREWDGDSFFKALRENGVTKHGLVQAKHELCIPRARRNVLEDGAVSYTHWVPPDWPWLTQDPPGVSPGKP